MNISMKYEGHWYSKREPHFPMPVHSDEPHPQKDEILEAYDTLMAQPIFIHGPDNGWGNREHVIAYRGVSSCRCCYAANGPQPIYTSAGRLIITPELKEYIDRSVIISLGNKEYRLNDWVWPEGFRHYIDVHNVIPTKDFLKEILNIELKD